MNITLPTRIFRSAIHCAAKNDIRWYLNAVQVEIEGRTATVISTDGSILFCGRAIFDEQAQSCNVLIPRETIEAALKGYKESTITLERDDSDHKHYHLGNTLFKPVDAVFPPWKKVIPEKISGDPGNYDPLLLAQIHKALAGWEETTPKKFTGNRMRLWQNGKNAAVAQGQDTDAFCIIMPYRPDLTLDIDWARA